MELVMGYDEVMARWAAERIPHVGVSGFGPCKAIGVAKDRRLYAVCVYHNYVPAYGVCEISFATATPRWATKQNIQTLLSVPFDQYGCRKVYLTIPSDNARALRFCGGIHFRPEATLRHHFGHKRHALILTMMADEYRRHWKPRAMKKAA